MFKSFGRYTGIIIVIIIFLMLIISVLGLNFYMSFQVEANAEKVNIAGRQRMLSQRTAKSLFDTQYQLNIGGDLETTVDELKKASDLFNSTLNAFEKGGNILGTSGNMIFLEPSTTERSVQIIKATHDLWDPFLSNVNDTIRSIENNDQAVYSKIENTIDYGHTNINTILGLMNDLTNEQEAIANEAATRSRLIQAFGIIAAMLCFLEIMRRISGKLRSADQLAEDAQRETQQIFDTVDQGLFLIDENFEMSDQYSKELVTIFADDDVSHRQLSSYLSDVVSKSDIISIERYMKILFDASKKESLISDLNPLKEVSIQVRSNNVSQHKYIRFNFLRVKHNNVIERVLVSVKDITTEVQLSRALERETKRNDKQIEMVSSIINADRTLIPIYLENSQKSLNEVNRLLKAPVHSSTGYQSKAKVIMGLIHGIKGESAALALDNITDICHEFEGHLTNIGISENVDGHDFVEPTVLLNKLLSFNTLLSDICDSLFGANGANGSLQSLDNTQTSSKNSINWDHLRTFSDEVAERQNKKVNLHIAGLNSPDLPSKLVACANTISSQLIRNAISHGIETPEERKRVNKSDSGIISISLFNVDNGGYRYVFEDDGAGIDFNKVARNAIKKGLISEEKAKKSSKLQLINLLFSSQLSTAENADIDKGRGAGMMAVLKAVKGLGGTISVGTSSAIGTRLIIDFPKQVSSLSTDNEADSVNKKNPIANKINVALT